MPSAAFAHPACLLLPAAHLRQLAHAAQTHMLTLFSWRVPDNGALSVSCPAAQPIQRAQVFHSLSDLRFDRLLVLLATACSTHGLQESTPLVDLAHDGLAESLLFTAFRRRRGGCCSRCRLRRLQLVPKLHPLLKGCLLRVAVWGARSATVLIAIERAAVRRNDGSLRASVRAGQLARRVEQNRTKVTREGGRAQSGKAHLLSQTWVDWNPTEWIFVLPWPLVCLVGKPCGTSAPRKLCGRTGSTSSPHAPLLRQRESRLRHHRVKQLRRVP